MTVIEIIFLVSGIVYILLGIMLILGILRHRPGKNDYEPFVSIVVPVRNEEKNIIRCLDALDALDYPNNKIELIIVDDHSEDSTVGLITSYKSSSIPIRLISLSSSPEKQSGKIAALTEGYRTAHGEIIFQTDADCAVPPQWVRAMVSHFSNNSGIVGGIILVQEGNKTSTCLAHIQSLDVLYLLGAGIGSQGINIPLSCFANNIAVRKMAYDAVGGYDRIPFTFTEDFALVQLVTSAGWKVHYALNENAIVYSQTPESLRSFINQRLRWLSGGLKYAGKGVILLGAAFILHILLIIGLFGIINSTLYITILGVVLSTDFIFLSILTKKINKKLILRFFFLFEFYYIVCTTFLGFIMPFANSLLWKGRDYKE